MMGRKIWLYSIPASLFLLSVSVFYYLVFYIPEVHKERQKEEEHQEQIKRVEELTKVKNLCLEKFEKWKKEHDEIVLQGISGCKYTGVCTYEQFMSAVAKSSNTPYYDARTPEFKAAYINKCISEYGSVGD